MAGESFASTAELHFSAGYAEQTKEEGNSPRLCVSAVKSSAEHGREESAHFAEESATRN